MKERMGAEYPERCWAAAVADLSIPGRDGERLVLPARWESASLREVSDDRDHAPLERAVSVFRARRWFQRRARLVRSVAPGLLARPVLPGQARWPPVLLGAQAELQLVDWAVRWAAHSA